MQNLLDCSILKDGLDTARGNNKVLRESLRYRFLYKNKDIGDVEYQANLNHLNNWYKWYTITYCKKITPCVPVVIIQCGTYAVEVPIIRCSTDIIVQEIN